MSHVDAVCDVIKSLGWNAMAKQYRDEPDKRSAVVAFISKQIAREFGNSQAKKFTRLAQSA